ncbi:unnamed protein product [Sympodiomycopsis kandeliae]
MLRTLVRRAAGRQPMIKFPDRSKAVSESHQAHPHPAAPSEIANQFSDFKKTLESGPHFDPNKLQDFKLLAAETATPVGAMSAHGPVQTGALDPSKVNSSATSSGSSSSPTRGDVAEDLHDLPSRFWKTPTLVLEEVEMDAIMSGGATLVQ